MPLYFDEKPFMASFCVDKMSDQLAKMNGKDFLNMPISLPYSSCFIGVATV